MEIRGDDGRMYYFPDNYFGSRDDLSREELQNARNFVIFMESRLSMDYDIIKIEELLAYDILRGVIKGYTRRN